jgi:hypothetical protein
LSIVTSSSCSSGRNPWTTHPFMSPESTLSLGSGSINAHRLRFLRSSSPSSSSHSAVSSSSSGIIIRQNYSLFPSLPSSCPANCVCDSTVTHQKRVSCTKGSLKQIPTEKMDPDTKVS